MNTFSELIIEPASGIGYRVCEPMPAKPTGLLVLLHGVGSNETNVADLAQALPAGTLVVLARGRLNLGPGQYAWFRVRFTAAGPQIVAKEADESREALIAFVQHLQLRYGVSAGRSLIAGFSQGGILSASVGLSSPESVRGFGVLSGRILPELESALASRDRFAHLHALVMHGSDDDKLPVSWAERAQAWLAELGVAHELKLFPGGHGLSLPMVVEFNQWVSNVLPSEVRS